MRRLSIGFIPLTDCAVLAVAHEKGFFRRHDIDARLVREVSWANLRDRVATGALDAAQLLAGMPLAASAGIDPLAEPMLTGLSLNLNGNAVTVSTNLWDRMRALHPEALSSTPPTAHALRAVIEDNRRNGRPLLRFATVYPFSTHNYELRYWLAAAGIDPDNEVDLSIVPPLRMVEMLGRAAIDGFCVGEPWSSLAVQRGLGRIVITKYEIWNNSPEKVFAVNRRFEDHNRDLYRAALRALIEAAAWAERRDNLPEVAEILSHADYVGAPRALLEPALGGAAVSIGAETVRPVPDFHVFHRYAANFPWVSHALWLLVQMVRWGQMPMPRDVMHLARSVYRPDLYREAARDLGINAPLDDMKTEGTHAGEWAAPGTTGPVTMGSDLFCDRGEFDPSAVGQL